MGVDRRVVPVEDHLSGDDGVEKRGEQEAPHDQRVVDLGQSGEDSGEAAEKSCESAV